MTRIHLTAVYDEGGIELGDRLLDDDMATLREYAQDAVSHINADVVRVDVKAYGPATPRDIYDLFREVREHPDFVFGTIFTRADFEGDPDDEDAQPRSVEGFLAHYGHHAEDRLAEIGNELIEDVPNEPTGGAQ